MPANGPNPVPGTLIPNVLGISNGTSALNTQTHTIIAAGAAQSTTQTAQQQMVAPQVPPGFLSHGILTPANPPMPTPTPPFIRKRCICGCDPCTCGCDDGGIITSPSLPTNATFKAFASHGPLNQAILQTGSQIIQPISGTKPCGCGGTRPQVYANSKCRCGCNPCRCSERKPAINLKPKLIVAPQTYDLSTPPGSSAISIKPYAQFQSDGQNTTKVDNVLNTVPIPKALSNPYLSNKNITSILSQSHGAPGQDYYPTYHTFLGSANLLTNVQVVSIFWGDYWNSSSLPLDQEPSSINEFLNFILTSSLIDLLGQEYSYGSNIIGHGSLKDSVTIPGKVNSPLYAWQIRAFIDKLVNPSIGSKNRVPYFGINTLYMIYIPSGIEVINDSAQRSCTDTGNGFDGYHDNNITPFPYAIGVICPCEGSSITKTISHELCEAITHPYGWSNGWYGDYSGPETDSLGTSIEIADECHNAFAFMSSLNNTYVVNPIWSRRQAACAISPWPWITMPYGVRNCPAISNNGDSLALAWTPFLPGPHNTQAPYGPIYIATNADTGDFSFSNPIMLRDPLDPNPEYTIDTPAISAGPKGTYIAWTAGHDLPNPHINVMVTINPLYQGWKDKVVLDEWSNVGPALAYVSPLFPMKGAPDGVLFLALTGTDQQIILRWSYDGTWPDDNKIVLQQWSLNAPCLCYANGYLYLAFRGTTSDGIYVCRASLGSDMTQFKSNFNLEYHTIPGQGTDYSPALTFMPIDPNTIKQATPTLVNQLIVAWRSSDSPHRFYAMSTDVTSTDPLTSFGNLVMYGDQAGGSVSLTTYPGNWQPYIAWAGTDSIHTLNVMPLPPHRDGFYS